MKRSGLILILVISSINYISAQERNKKDNKELKVDFEYSPKWWQTAICMVDDPLKTVVGKEGQLFYDFQSIHYANEGPFKSFNTVIEPIIPSNMRWEKQELYSPKIPIVKTFYENDSLQIMLEAFTVAPSLKVLSDTSHPDYLGIKVGGKTIYGNPHNDIVIMKFKNKTKKPISVSPAVMLKSADFIRFSVRDNTMKISKQLLYKATAPINSIADNDTTITQDKKDIKLNRKTITYNKVTLKAGEEFSMAYGVNAGKDAEIVPKDMQQANGLRDKTIKYWQDVDLPYNKIIVPDTQIQNIINSSIRNIHQAREIINGETVYQVGPTIYRSLWVVDGSFILEAMTYLGQIENVRHGIEHLLSYQREDGSFMLINEYWKETGIVLWALSRHAMLTGDKQWLESKWSKAELAFNYIASLRKKTMETPDAPNAGLMPKGFTDGGIEGSYYEYSNVYWNLTGMKAIIGAAEWLGKKDEAEKWQKEYDDFYKTYIKSAHRDMKTDKYGNKYVPVKMVDTNNVLPQKGQWAFLHAIYPGQVFERNNDILIDNMKMLKAVEREGLIYNTGWHDDGIWNYFASFYGHALLWIGEGRKAAEILYAFANHASPELVWREEHSVKEAKEFSPIGDMPHNWASAEFIRLTRHLIVLERGKEIHLFEGLPKEWCKPKMRTELNGIYTDFGILKLSLVISDDGKEATVDFKLDNKNHDIPSSVVIHTDGINGKKETIEEKGKTEFKKVIKTNE